MIDWADHLFDMMDLQNLDDKAAMVKAGFAPLTVFRYYFSDLAFSDHTFKLKIIYFIIKPHKFNIQKFPASVRIPLEPPNSPTSFPSIPLDFSNVKPAETGPNHSKSEIFLPKIYNSSFSFPKI